VELPGPASWWPDDYDYRACGWEADPDSDAAYDAAVMIMTDYDEVPEEFSRYYPDDNMLTLLPKSTLKNVYLNFR
jgi:hypothetical protein